MKTIPPQIDIEAALQDQAATDRSVRFNQGWLNFDSPSETPGSQNQVPQTAHRGDGGSMTQGPGGIYGTGMDYGSVRHEMVSADRVQEPSSPHPFKLYVVDDGGPKLEVEFGQIERTRVITDSGGNEIFAIDYVGVYIAAGDLRNDPDSPIGSVGQASLSVSTTYGVWLKIQLPSIPDTSTPPGGIDATETVTAVHYGSEQTSAEIIASSTYTLRTQAAAITASTEGYAYKYIGRVAIDGQGSPTISQHQRSDIILPGGLYPKHILSTDADNALGLGVVNDNGLYLSLSEGTDISITGSPGAKTISYSP